MKKLFKTTLSVSDISNLTNGKNICPAPDSGKGHRIISISEDIESGTPWSNTAQYVSCDSPNAEWKLEGILNTGTKTIGKFEKYGIGGDNVVVTSALTLLTFQTPTGGNKSLTVYVCVEEIDIINN